VRGVKVGLIEFRSLVGVLLKLHGVVLLREQGSTEESGTLEGLVVPLGLHNLPRKIVSRLRHGGKHLTEMPVRRRTIVSPNPLDPIMMEYPNGAERIDLLSEKLLGQHPRIGRVRDLGRSGAESALILKIPGVHGRPFGKHISIARASKRRSRHRILGLKGGITRLLRNPNKGSLSLRLSGRLSLRCGRG